MHELSVAESMMDLVLENARENEAARVTKVTIVVGNLAGIVTDSLRFCFDAIKKDTMAEGAELLIEEVVATARCPECEKDFTVGQYDFACPRCQGVIIPSGGKELYLKNLEVE